jgi:hypothetical protein
MGGSNVGLFNVHRTVITIIERRPILPINGTIFPAPITLSLTGIPSVETATIAPRRPSSPALRGHSRRIQHCPQPRWASRLHPRLRGLSLEPNSTGTLLRHLTDRSFQVCLRQ